MASLSTATDGLNVPVGPDAFPKYARTSPLVSMPRIPVPFIASGLLILCSTSNRWTEGNKGRECVGSTWETGPGGEVGCGVATGGLEAWGAGDVSSGASKLVISSPSSARRAIVLPTGTFLLPAGICTE